MWYHLHLDPPTLKNLLLSNTLQFGGNKKLKIYGTLSCSSGKRMKKHNRVFFATENEAIKKGYRPCGHCLRKKYEEWKSTQESG